MSLSVVGSIAFDTVETPSGKRNRMLGGAAVHFALASSLFTETNVVGPVGDDFGKTEFDILESRGVVTDDIERVLSGKTFFWEARYERGLNTRHTITTELNVFENFEPKLSQKTADAEVLFLANIQPDLQRTVRESCHRARFSALDSMNLWIEIARDSLVQTIGTVDCVLLNDEELMQLSNETTMLRAAQVVLGMGPRAVIVKQGAFGAALYTESDFFALPAYPLANVVDPTGAGDTFAGGFMGYIAAHCDGEVTDEVLRTAMAYGTTLASFNVEGFGTDVTREVTLEQVEQRVRNLHQMTSFELESGRVVL